jgi:hypothetical protein
MSRQQTVARLAIAARRRSRRGDTYDRMVARLRDLGSAGLALLNATDRQLVERYFRLGGAPPVSLRELETQTGLRRLDIQRRVRQRGSFPGTRGTREAVERVRPPVRHARCVVSPAHVWPRM